MVTALTTANGLYHANGAGAGLGRGGLGDTMYMDWYSTAQRREWLVVTALTTGRGGILYNIITEWTRHGNRWDGMARGDGA